jgi:hypothetical protein
MTAISPTRTFAVRDGVIAGTACISLLGSYGKFHFIGRVSA